MQRPAVSLLIHLIPSHPFSSEKATDSCAILYSNFPPSPLEQFGNYRNLARPLSHAITRRADSSLALPPTRARLLRFRGRFCPFSCRPTHSWSRSYLIRSRSCRRQSAVHSVSLLLRLFVHCAVRSVFGSSNHRRLSSILRSPSLYLVYPRRTVPGNIRLSATVIYGALLRQQHLLDFRPEVFQIRPSSC